MLRTLGTGSTSTVYLAEHLRLKTRRAIKCIPKDKTRSSSFSLELCPPTEAELLKNLRHPGIPLIFDIDEDETNIYIIEEYIQGESLDQFMIHQESISQELIRNIGIQLCDILDYLHHIAPYPILYQDLKPEHIIVCGDQVKLIDFGIASFFTGFGKNFQFYGTDGFIAPEALAGQSIGPAADIYSLGRVLLYIAEHTRIPCSPQLLHAIQKAAANSVKERFETVSGLKTALLAVPPDTACRNPSHLIKNIAVLGSRPGAGATHFAISLVCALNRLGLPATYLATDSSCSFSSILAANPHMAEKEGIYRFHYFSGMPLYGQGIQSLLPTQGAFVNDYGIHADSTELDKADLIILILSGSDWDFSQSLSYAKSLCTRQNIVFICNYDKQKAAKKFAQQLGRNVYCFPPDTDPFRVTPAKERLVSSIISQKGVTKKSCFIRKRKP